MNKHKPILHIYQHGDQFFAAPPDFVDLQESEVAFVDPSIILEILATIDSKARARIANAEIDTVFQRAQRTDAEKDAILACATPGRLAGDGDGARL